MQGFSGSLTRAGKERGQVVMRSLVSRVRKVLGTREKPREAECGSAENAFSLPDYSSLVKRSVSGVGRVHNIGPVLFMNSSGERAVPEQRTVVVLGGYRGGTSMVAGLLRLMGLFMGFRLGQRNNEDLDFQGAPPERIIELAEERGRMFDLWGWKCPGSIYSMDRIAGHLRNPRFIVIFRDVMAIAQNEMAREIYGFEEAVWRSADQQMRLADFVLKSSHPTLAASYERAVRDSDLFVRSLADFVGLDFPGGDFEKLAMFIRNRRQGRVSLFRRRIGLEHYGALEHRHGVREIRGGKQDGN
jgi:hypothetical protein